MRWTRKLRLTSAARADGEVVWSRHPEGWCQVRGKQNFPRATVAKVQGSPRRARISRKPSRRESRMPPLDLYARVRLLVHYLHTRPRVQRAPGFPCALLLLEGEESDSKARAHGAARMRRRVYGTRCLKFESADIYRARRRPSPTRSSPGLTGRPSIPEAVAMEIERPRRTGSSAFAEDDELWWMETLRSLGRLNRFSSAGAPTRPTP